MTKELEGYSEITWIRADKLSVVWVESQRPFDEKWAREIADEFDPQKLDPPVVTKPNAAGQYHIISGQHRVAAVVMALGKDQQVPCRIIAEADPARAAELFLGMSNNKAMKPIHEFLVAVKANRPLEVSVNKIVRRCGYKVSAHTQTPDSVSAVSALKRIYQRHGEFILQSTLNTCRALWGSDSHGVTGTIVLGMSLFLNEFGRHVETSRLRKQVTDKYKSPGSFVEAVRYEKKQMVENMSVSTSSLLVKIYNKGLPESRRLRRKGG
jgi:hypothetical protein